MSDQDRACNRADGSDPAESPSRSFGATGLGDAFETVFDAVDDAVFVFDVEREGDERGFRFRRNNPTHASRTGVRASEWQGRTPHEILEGDDGAVLADQLRTCLERQATIEYERPLEYPAGTVEWHAKLTPIVEDGVVTRIVGIARDRTVCEERERELERYEAFVEHSSDAIAVLDPDGTVEYVSSASERVLGCRAELVDANLLEYADADHEDRVRDALAHVQEGGPGTSATVEYRFECSPCDAAVRWVESCLMNALDDPAIDGILVTTRDVTDRKERERVLERSRKRLRVLFDESPDAVIVHDASGAVLDVNEALVENLGYAREELLSMTVTDFEVGLDPAEAHELWAGMEIGETARIEGEHERADGSRFPVEVWINKIEIGDEPRYLALSRDITERKESEAALERARNELRRIIDLVPDPIFAKTADGEYVLANEATASYYGLTPADVEGRTDRELLPDEAQARQFREDDLAVIESREPQRAVEEELLTADGDTRILQTTKIPYEVSETGEDAVLGYARDVTELKTYERRLETQCDNLEMLNQVVRHDIRNDLQLVLAYAETLRDRVDGEDREYVERVLSSAHEAVEITESAREVAEAVLRADSDLEAFDLSTVLANEVDAVRATHDDAIVAVEGTVPDTAVVADDMVGAVFRNLLTNAIEHNDEQVPEVTVAATDDDDRVAVRVSDNGPGIPDDCKDRIFNEGETALDSNGTGLGLSLVRTLVERYDGAVRITDGDGEGATFVVELPVAD